MAEVWSMPSPAEGRVWSEEKAVEEAVSMTSALVGSLLCAERATADA